MHRGKRTAAVDPYYRIFTIHDLPAPDQKRWTTIQTARVLIAISNGLIALEEVVAQYQIVEQELRIWQMALESGGIRELKTCRKRHA